MTRVDLSDGNWAELREPEQVSERLRRPIQRALARVSVQTWEVVLAAKRRRDGDEAQVVEAEVSDRDFDSLNEANDHCIVALVAAWSFPNPITLESVLDLPSRDYAVLRERCAPAVGSLFVSFDPTPELQSPTAPSSVSSGRSGAEAWEPRTLSLTSGAPGGSSSSD